jgi:hypothetical protein
MPGGLVPHMLVSLLVGAAALLLLSPIIPGYDTEYAQERPPVPTPEPVP